MDSKLSLEMSKNVYGANGIRSEFAGILLIAFKMEFEQEEAAQAIDGAEWALLMFRLVYEIHDHRRMVEVVCDLENWKG